MDSDMSLVGLQSLPYLGQSSRMNFLKMVVSTVPVEKEKRELLLKKRTHKTMTCRLL